MVEEEVEVASVEIDVPVRYDEEQISRDFPLRYGDSWRASIDIDSGQIKDWPAGKSGRLHLKVCDCGIYTLRAPDGSELAAIVENYVPNRLIPGSYGDDIDLIIDENGIVTNWPKEPSLEDFTED